MTKTLRQIFHIRAAMSCNRLLYWLGRLPLVRRGIRPALYANLSLKQTLVVLVTVLQTLGAFLGKLLYLGLCCVLPLALVLGDAFLQAGWPIFVQMLCFLSFFAGCFMQSEILTASLLKYTCVRQMGMSARRFLLAQVGRTHLIALLSFTPGLMVCAALLGQRPLAGLALSLALAATRLLAELIHVAIYHKTGKILSRSVWYIMTVTIVGLAGAYLPLLPKRALPLDRILLHPVALGLLLLAGGLSLAWLLRYPRYRALTYATCKAEHVSSAAARQTAAQAAFRDVQLRDGDLVAGPADRRLEGLQGYDYLNALFFRRHRRLLVRPVCIELLIVAGTLALGLVGCLFFREALAKALTGIGSLLPVCVFLMYLAGNTLGQRICKAMFYNCDISLLRYGWYRRPQVVLRNFAVRLRRVAALNLLVAGAICLAVLILLPASGAAPPAEALIPFLLCILCLSVLFSVHPLFLYYTFQPYTTQLAVKNPLFGIINWVMYFVCWMCVQIKQPPQGFAVIVLCATLIYIAVALLLVWRRAPKTFRVK